MSYKQEKEKFKSPLLERKGKGLYQVNTKNRMERLRYQEVARFYPVISLSNEKGYEILDDPTAYPQEELVKNIHRVNHQVRDYMSRIDALKKRMKSLIAWAKEADKVREDF